VVGIVIVSHSGTLAEGVRELAAEMAGPDVRIELAGGLAEEGALGTDAVRVMEAIGRADTGDGVLVLMDLGSAVLSAETALDFLTPEQRESVLLCEAPLVEGAVAAAVAARLGGPLAEVAKEARGGLQGKVAQLGAGEPAAPGPAGTSDSTSGTRSGCMLARRRASSRPPRASTRTSR
jgi:dihydroxyacetone kinase phosphotransfer subunit